MKTATFAGLVLALLLTAGCGGEEPLPFHDRQQAWEELAIGGTEAEFDAAARALADMPVDPPPRVGEDYQPEFPALLPFDPSEWETGEVTDIVADPRAKKGGKLILGTEEWPPTIRTDGPASRLSLLFSIHSLIYETLLGWDPTGEKFVPGLAKYWQIGADKMTYRFRIDERARWSDGREVTADDVVASIEDHYKNADRKDPSIYQDWQDRVEYARVLDKYVVEVKAREPFWESMLTIGQNFIFPAAYIRMDGGTYLSEWNWKLPPGSGPYSLDSADIRKGRSITLRRREDWWARDLPENRYTCNFDEIEWQVVLDEELLYQKVQAGEIDMTAINIAQRWVEELDHAEPIRRGLIQKRKIYNLVPQGFDGYCLNLRRKPFDRRNVRLAFAHLLNREQLFAKFFFYEYEYIDSYYPFQEYSRQNASRIHYDPKKARELLAEEGWKRRDAEGYLVNGKGERFPTLTLEFDGSGTAQRIHDLYRSDLWNEAGIRLELKVLDYASQLKKVWEYQFDLVRWGWTASLFPAPEQNWHSKYADQPQSNNLAGFKDPEADRIMEAYKVEFDPRKRNEMLRRLDAIFFDAHPYALGWVGPYFRFIYWDKFGHPPEYVGRYTRDFDSVLTLWWYDEDRARRTAANRERGRKNHDAPLGQYDAVEHRYWLDHRLSVDDGHGVPR
jgi:ABC-type transport system substrate-binding protein